MNISLGGRTGRWIAGAAAAFLVLPLALAAPASAVVSVDRTPDRQVEQSQNAPENQPNFWLGENGSTQCWKHEGTDPIDGGSHGKVLASDKSVWQMGTPPTGKVFSLLVLKSATMNDVFYDPTPGALYGTVSLKDISHVIVCKKPAPQQVVAAPPTFTDPTCENQNTAAVKTTPVTGVKYTTVGDVVPGGSVTVTATAEAGYVLAPGQSQWQHTFTAAEDCTEPTKVTPQATFTDPTCDNDNTASWTGTPIEGVTYKLTDGKVGPGQTVTVTATLDEDVVLAEGAQTTFQHTFSAAEDCTEPTKVTPQVTFTDPTCDNDNTASWTGTPIEGVTYKLTDSEVGPGQTVTVTATLAEGLVLTEGATTTFEHTFAAAEDCTEQPPTIEVAVKDPVCVQDAPYLKYALKVTGTSNTTSTITFLNPNAGGADVVFADQPLEGQLLWPGAAVGADGKATEWPGWKLVGGEWVQGDEYDWVRPTVQVRFQVNPETTVTVSYPPANSACADPPKTEVLDTTVTPPPAALPATLPATGSSGTQALLGYALLLLTAGAALVALPGRFAKATR